MHTKIVNGYSFKENTFDLYLTRSYDGTKWIDSPNTNIKVVFKFPPTPVMTKVLAPVVTRVLAPVPIFTPPVVSESVSVEEMGKKRKKLKA